MSCPQVGGLVTYGKDCFGFLKHTLQGHVGMCPPVAIDSRKWCKEVKMLAQL